MNSRATATTGSVLIVVLIVCLGLVSLTLVFGHAMLMAYRGSDNDLAGRQADQAIEGAARYAEYILTQTGTAGVFPDRTTYQSEAVPLGDALFWFIGRPGDADAPGQLTFGLVDEASKLNINTATLDMLQALPGMPADLAAAIIDWRDKDETPTAGGAESETYMLRNPGYASKNAPFESTEELALVNGASISVLYGEDANLNGALDPNEDDGTKTPPDDNSDGILDSGVLEYLTAYSREPNKRSDGTARINVSRVNAQVRTLLSDTFGSDRVNAIVAALGNTQSKSLLEFFIRSRMTEDEFSQISDAITVSNAQYIVGLVNVNTASQAVLACIPGIGADNAANLVAARANLSTPPTNIAWVAGTLNRQAAIQAGPYLTAQSYQVSADVAAVGRHGRGYRRTLFVIDNTGDAPKIVYRRNMAPLGWALGDAVRQMLIAKEQGQ